MISPGTAPWSAGSLSSTGCFLVLDGTLATGRPRKIASKSNGKDGLGMISFIETPHRCSGGAEQRVKRFKQFAEIAGEAG